MSKIAVVYWSGTGSTEAMAAAVADGAREAGAAVEVFTAAEFDAARMDASAFSSPCPNSSPTSPTTAAARSKTTPTAIRSEEHTSELQSR